MAWWTELGLFFGCYPQSHLQDEPSAGVTTIKAPPPARKKQRCRCPPRQQRRRPVTAPLLAAGPKRPSASWQLSWACRAVPTPEASMVVRYRYSTGIGMAGYRYWLGMDKVQEGLKPPHLKGLVAPAIMIHARMCESQPHARNWLRLTSKVQNRWCTARYFRTLPPALLYRIPHRLMLKGTCILLGISSVARSRTVA